MSNIAKQNPDHPFLGVQVKTKENHPKHQGFVTPLDPSKTPRKKQRKTVENPRNTKEFPCLQKKTKENQNTKEWNYGRSGKRNFTRGGSFNSCTYPPTNLRTTLQLLGNLVWKGGKDPHPQDFSLTKKTARFTKDQFRPY